MEKTSANGSMTDVAYDTIQNQIVTGALKSHELLSESEIARELNCGRTPVREALQRLKFEGFVEILPRRGILVTAVDVSKQLELLETRRPLENLVVTLACKRASDAQREEMRSLADRLESAIAEADRSRYLAINKAIHLLEAEAANNRFLQSQINVIHNLSRRFWFSFISDTHSFSKAAVCHADTLRAIADGDQEMAARHNSGLMDLLEAVTRQAIDQR
ncbi:FCD domain-containing protein [Martelella radicis]|uniref:DNA-binding GntR family transcriptional regulator n=1 Tax=Martelella radicis TaxID=1397476 RepID=A0A7W6PD57_9HYPH|nr:DNA-binding GntR family transcriptional regulator [Martelella radicis]